MSISAENMHGIIFDPQDRPFSQIMDWLLLPHEDGPTGRFWSAHVMSRAIINLAFR